MASPNEGHTEIDLVELMNQYDGVVESPRMRGVRVMEVLKKHTPNTLDWDVLCFSIEFLSAMIEVHPWLDKQSITRIKRLIYLAHYTQYAPNELLTGHRTDAERESENEEGSDSSIFQSGEIHGDD